MIRAASTTDADGRTVTAGPLISSAAVIPEAFSKDVPDSRPPPPIRERSQARTGDR